MRQGALSNGGANISNVSQPCPEIFLKNRSDPSIETRYSCIRRDKRLWIQSLSEGPVKCCCTALETVMKLSNRHVLLWVFPFALMLNGCVRNIEYSKGLSGGVLKPCPDTYSKTTWTNCYGAIKKSDGGRYVGEWKYGTGNGQGTITLPDGRKYVGEIKNGKSHGQGTATSPDGSKYVGEYKNDQNDGHGTITLPDGSGYVGEFKNGKLQGQGTFTFRNGSRYVGAWKNGKPNGQGQFTAVGGKIQEGVFENGKFKIARKKRSTVIAKQIPPNVKPKPRLNENRKESEPTPKAMPPTSSSSTSGSGFFVSKLGHVVTNQHVVQNCTRILVGDNAKKQVQAELIEADKRNDLALLKLSSMELASAETKSLIRKLGIRVANRTAPLSSEGLLRSEDVQLGERVMVSGYPYGEIFSDTIKVTGGMVSAIKGMGDDSGQFQIDAAVQPGNSGGPIYDQNGNIVGVVVSQLNKLKVAKAIGSLPENVNFGIKASTVRQFLTSAGLPTKWSSKSERLSSQDLAKIGRQQTVMVVCHRQ